MKRLGLAAVLILGLLLQISWLPALRPLGVVPDFALILIVLTGLEGTASMALGAAVAGGLVLDLASGANFGLWTGTLVLTALASGMLHRAGIEPGVGVSCVMVVVGTLLMTAIILAGLVNVVVQWPKGALIGRFMIELVINLTVTVALRPLMRWLVPGSLTAV